MQIAEGRGVLPGAVHGSFSGAVRRNACSEHALQLTLSEPTTGPDSVFTAHVAQETSSRSLFTLQVFPEHQLHVGHSAHLVQTEKEP